MFFSEVLEAKPDPIFGRLGAFQADPRAEKVNLMVGIYKDDHLKAELLSSVKKAQELVTPQEITADYLPISGLGEMSELLGGVIFGQTLWEAAREKILGVHTTGGTGALRVGAEFLAHHVTRSICISNYTWPNHPSVFSSANLKLEKYPYYSQEKKGFDFAATLDFLKNLPQKTAVLLHACCHNPTGCDPTLDEWREISKVMKENELLPFFDFAYQGIGQGLEKDAEAVRMFLQDGHEMMIAYSCSKSFSMYCQRVGALFVVGENLAAKEKVASQIKAVIRALYSNPPAHGAKIVCEVLKNPTLKQMWLKDLEEIRTRLNSMREQLIQRLSSGTKHLNFDFLRRHIGMFSFIDLNKLQVQTLIEKYAIYMTDNGRVSVAGLSSKNIDYVANSLLAVCEER